MLDVLDARADRLLKGLHEARPWTVRLLLAVANQHIRWELNDLARRLDNQRALAPMREGLAPSPASGRPGSARTATA
jgi:RNA polymerase sigma-70 factor (ECF subfamily)